MENFGHKITVQKCSFTNLESIEGSSFDHIFSNFGGLNCTDDLQKVVDQCNQLLNPGGVVTFVLMSKICLWEFLYLFKGNFKLATRRLSGKGSRSHLEGVYFTTYYYNPSHVAGMFGKKYQRICIKGLGLLSPPPYLPHIASANPRLYKLLCKIEEKIDGYVPFNGWGDHYVISMKKIS
jgi:SAM-dependent methyltransferase